MKKSKSAFHGILIATFIAATGWAGVVEKEARELQQECLISLDEPWRTIPWKVSLLEAQKLAAKERKPIFIWAMDGHPLGCT